MTTLTYTLRDSATMVRRNFRHTLRYPSAVVMSLGVPALLLLLFVGVFGGALTAGVGPRGAAYIDYVVPGILLMAVGYGSSTDGAGGQRGHDRGHHRRASAPWRSPAPRC